MVDCELNFEWAPGQHIVDIEEDDISGPAKIIDNNRKGNTGRELIIFDEDKDNYNNDEIMDGAIEKYVITENYNNDDEIHHTERIEI